jgi:hypothetical protein
MSAIFATLSQINDASGASRACPVPWFGAVLGENMKKSGQGAIFCALQRGSPLFLHCKRLEISRFQKNFTKLRKPR